MAKVKPTKTQQSPPESVQQKSTESVNFFDNSLKNKGIYIFWSLALVLGFLIFREYLTGKAILMFKDIGCDSMNATYPAMMMLTDYLKSDGIPGWSFQQGMGQNIYPLWFDQFQWILSFLDKKDIPFGIVWVLWLELLLSGYLFFTYLRMIKVSELGAIIGGLCYAYGGYAILAGAWMNFFAIELFNVAFLLLALERFIQKNSWWMLPIPIALMTIDQPFTLYNLAILIVGYTIFRSIEIYGKPSFSTIKTLFSIGLIASLGVAMGAILGLSNIQQYIDSPRVSGDDSHTNELFNQLFSTLDGKHFMTWITRMFNNDLLGTGEEYKGWNNYFEAPAFYIGLLSLVALPQLFQFLSRRQKILYGIVLGFCFLPIIFPVFRYIFWGFTGDYYRNYALFFGIFILRFGMQALTEIEASVKFNKWMILATVVSLIALLLIPYDDTISIDKSIRMGVIVFLILNGLLLFGLGISGIKGISQILLLVLVCAELLFSSSKTINSSKRMAWMASDNSERVGFNDYSQEAVDYLKKTDKSFYRLQKNYGSSPAIYGGLNDSQLQGFAGTQCYYSFNQLNYVRFMTTIDVVQRGNENSSRWVSGIPGNTLLYSMIGVKYYLVNGDIQIFKTIGFDSLTTIGSTHIMRNAKTLPLGVTYNTYMTEDDFNKNKFSTLYKSKAFLKSCVIDKSLEAKVSGLKKLTQIDTSAVFTTNTEFQEILDGLKKDSLQITKFSQNKIEGNISTDTPKILFLSIPFDKGWHAILDGKETTLERVQFGLTGLVLDKGKHQLTLQFEPPFRALGTKISIVALLAYLGLVFWTRKKGTI
jgi:uncharacterized membrane protein YfhO